MRIDYGDKVIHLQSGDPGITIHMPDGKVMVVKPSGDVYVDGKWWMNDNP